MADSGRTIGEPYTQRNGEAPKPAAAAPPLKIQRSERAPKVGEFLHYYSDQFSGPRPALVVDVPAGWSPRDNGSTGQLAVKVFLRPDEDNPRHTAPVMLYEPAPAGSKLNHPNGESHWLEWPLSQGDNVAMWQVPLILEAMLLKTLLRTKTAGGANLGDQPLTPDQTAFRFLAYRAVRDHFLANGVRDLPADPPAEGTAEGRSWDRALSAILEALPKANRYRPTDFVEAPPESPEATAERMQRDHVSMTGSRYTQAVFGPDVPPALRAAVNKSAEAERLKTGERYDPNPDLSHVGKPKGSEVFVSSYGVSYVESPVESAAATLFQKHLAEKMGDRAPAGLTWQSLTEEQRTNWRRLADRMLRGDYAEGELDFDSMGDLD